MARKQKKAKAKASAVRAGDDVEVEPLEDEDGGINSSDMAESEHDTDEEKLEEKLEPKLEPIKKSRAKKKPAQNKKRTDETKNWGTLKFQLGVDENLPPLNNFDDYLSQYIDKLMAAGFGKVIDHLNGRKVLVATACSGTDAPILFLNALSEGIFSKVLFAFAIY